MRIIQLSSNRQSLEETASFCGSLKNMGYKIEDIVTHFKSIRDSSERQRLPPLSVSLPNEIKYMTATHFKFKNYFTNSFL